MSNATDSSLDVGLSSGDPDESISDARAAERHGFDYLACGEHLFFHGPTPNAFIQLAAAAGATERIRLVSAITPLALYPPALAAKLACTLDRVSAGRFELGVGAAGEFPPEFEAVGVDPATRFRRLDEALALLRALFSGEPTTFEGAFTSIQDLALRPSPRQPGGPPIWVAGRKAAAMRRAGRFADVWLPYMVTPTRLRATLDEVHGHAVAGGRAPEAVSGAVYLWTAVGADGDTARQSGIEVVSESYKQDFTPLADKYLVLGSPDQVVARLHEFALAGARKIILQLACRPSEKATTIELLGREVLPPLRAMVSRSAGASPATTDR